MKVKCICNVIGTAGNGELMRFESIEEGKLYQVESDDGFQLRLYGMKGKFDKERFEEVDKDGLTAEERTTGKKSVEKKKEAPATEGHKKVNKLKATNDEGECPF